MAGKFDEYFERMADRHYLLSLKEIMQLDQQVQLDECMLLDVVNGTQFVRLPDGKATPKVYKLNKDDLAQYRESAEQITVEEMCARESKDLFQPVGDRFVVDRARAIKGSIVNRLIRLALITENEQTNKFLKSFEGVGNLSIIIAMLRANSGYFEDVEKVISLIDDLRHLNMWNMILMMSIWAQAEADTQLKISTRASEDKIATHEIEYLEAERHTIDKLNRGIVETYIHPKARAINMGEKAFVEVNAAFSKAWDVFTTCEKQIRSHYVPEAYQPLVYQLVDETAKGLSGNYDGNRYLSVVKSLPLEHTAFRIIVGAALAFAGLMLAAAAITLAVHSFGVSTPLSALGVAVGVDMILAGFAMAAAAITLGLAGTATFFAKSKVPTEFAQQNPEGVKAITEKAEEFHAHQSTRMGG